MDIFVNYLLVERHPLDNERIKLPSTSKEQRSVYCFSLKLSITKLQQLEQKIDFFNFVKEAKELWIILGFDANKAESKSIRIRRIKKMAMNNNKTKLQQIR